MLHKSVLIVCLDSQEIIWLNQSMWLLHAGKARDQGIALTII